MFVVQISPTQRLIDVLNEICPIEGISLVALNNDPEEDSKSRVNMEQALREVCLSDNPFLCDPEELSNKYDIIESEYEDYFSNLFLQYIENYLNQLKKLKSSKYVLLKVKLLEECSFQEYWNFVNIGYLRDDFPKSNTLSQ